MIKPSPILLEVCKEDILKRFDDLNIRPGRCMPVRSLFRHVLADHGADCVNEALRQLDAEELIEWASDTFIRRL